MYYSTCNSILRILYGYIPSVTLLKNLIILNLFILWHMTRMHESSFLFSAIEFPGLLDLHVALLETLKQLGMTINTETTKYLVA